MNHETCEGKTKENLGFVYLGAPWWGCPPCKRAVTKEEREPHLASPGHINAVKKLTIMSKPDQQAAAHFGACDIDLEKETATTPTSPCGVHRAADFPCPQCATPMHVGDLWPSESGYRLKTCMACHGIAKIKVTKRATLSRDFPRPVRPSTTAPAAQPHEARAPRAPRLATPEPVVIQVQNDASWQWFTRSDITPEIHARITGKYLFFSPIRDILIDVVRTELGSGGFYHAKINSEQRKTGSDNVLCLYYSDDSRKHELADKYRTRQFLDYRYWKSDADTRAGKYSAQHLANQAERNE